MGINDPQSLLKGSKKVQAKVLGLNKRDLQEVQSQPTDDQTLNQMQTADDYWKQVFRETQLQQQGQVTPKKP